MRTCEATDKLLQYKCKGKTLVIKMEVHTMKFGILGSKGNKTAPASACGAADPKTVPASACGAADPAPASACGAADPEKK
ncbi:MAG: hypothetical protein ACYDGZ_01770 [Desulfosporosinus fructosivorans]